jgi:hypothetical protein
MHELTIDQLETVSAAADSRFTFSIMGLADVTSIHYDSRGSGAVECHAVQFPSGTVSTGCTIPE